MLKRYLFTHQKPLESGAGLTKQHDLSLPIKPNTHKVKNLDHDTTILSSLAQSKLGINIASIKPLRAHASARKIYRMTAREGQSYIGVINEHIDENIAFTGFSQSFINIGIKVPLILASNQTTAYIESDLGDTTLMDVLQSSEGMNTPLIFKLYQDAIEALLNLQANGLQAIDQRLCYQGALFDGSAIAKDIQYFCDEYLQRVNLWGSQDDLSSDVAELIEACQHFERGFFMHRDFQSRNIMVHNDELYLIDYQSGREGPLQYDLASLLFQSKANLPFTMRESLLEYYLERANAYFQLDVDQFKQQYLIFVLIRALQNLGAYGKQGLGNGKEYFKTSISYALKNCRYLLEHWPQQLKCPNLRDKLERAIHDDNTNL